ncbi:MAG: hypothetical protein ACREEV_11485, partial [Dongiaceae bacterium]
VLGGVATLPGTRDRTIVSLSRGGSDAVVLREFDLAAKAFVADGFVLPEAKGGAAWLDRDTLLLSSALGSGMATTSGYARTVRLWRRGADVAQAPVLFETTPENMTVGASVDRTQPAEAVWFVERPGFFDMNVWLGDHTGPKTKLDLPTDVSMEAHRDWLALKRRGAWTIGGKTYPPDTVLGTSLSAFLSGDRNVTMLFEPGERRAPQDFFWADGRLVLSILDELRPMSEVFTPSAAGWTRAKLPGLPEIGIVNVWRLDTEEAESNGDLLANVQDPVTPASLMLLERGQGPTVLKRAPRTFDAGGLVVSRHEATSVDGERIPYVQVGPKAETGDAPVHLYGYGGFQVSMLPGYASAVGKLWLERGGTHVIACIRGGGEFGTRWHEAARREKRRLAHD